MLKIYQVFVYKFLFLILSTFTLVSVISYLFLEDYLIQEKKSDLRSIINVLEMNLETVNELDSYVLSIRQKTDLRVTIVDINGKILAESNAIKEEMDNHSVREEIEAAKSVEYASCLRYSDTLNMDFLYMAKKLSYKSKDIYLRVSISVEDLMKDFYTLWITLALVLATVLLLSLYITREIANRVLYDIKQLREYLEAITKKDYKAHLHIKYYYEFLEIALLLKNIVKRLNNRDKKIDKKSDKK